MQQQQQQPGGDGSSCRGLPVDDPRLLVDALGHMPFHYATNQGVLYILLHPRTNLTTFALMPTAARSAAKNGSVRSSNSSDFESTTSKRRASFLSAEGANKRRSSSLSTDATVTGSRALKEELWAQLWAQLIYAAQCAPDGVAPLGVRGSGVSLSGSSIGEADQQSGRAMPELNAVTAARHRNEPSQLAGEPGGSVRQEAYLLQQQQAEALSSGSPQHRPETPQQQQQQQADALSLPGSPPWRQRHRCSYPGSILSGMGLPRTFTSPKAAYGNTTHSWRCELLPCQHSMCGGCAEQLFECQEPVSSIRCPMCQTPVKELRPVRPAS